MNDHYHLDVATYSLDAFRNMLKVRELVPSRMSLKDDLDKRFDKLASAGLSTMQDLLDVLGTKPKLEQFSKQSGLPLDYLTLLKREAGSYLPNPVRLDKYPGIPGKHVERLAELGIKHSRHMFRAAAGEKLRDELSRRTNVPIDVLKELVCLSDLSRVYGVGPVFARMLYDVGITSIEVMRSHTAADVVRVYERETGKKADFGAGEIQFSLDIARELDIVVEI